MTWIAPRGGGYSAPGPDIKNPKPPRGPASVMRRCVCKVSGHSTITVMVDLEKEAVVCVRCGARELFNRGS